MRAMIETTRHNNEKATIYDYKTGEEIRQASAEEEQRYIAQLLSMSANERMYGIVDGDEYGHDGCIYMYGGSIEDEMEE